MRVSSHLILAVAALSGLAIVALAATGRGGEDNGTIVALAATAGGGEDNGTILACVKPSGKIRIISSEDSCIPTETMLIWNIVGPEGQQGPEGEQGPQGEPGLTPEQEEILSHMSIVFLDDGMGNLIKTIRISGVNVQVVNGMDDTETTNGAGNLIIGYNEAFSEEDRSGSHNLVVGIDHTFNSYGGFVAGLGNNITAPYASVSGGTHNTASGGSSSVSGGQINQAVGVASSVSGGNFNFAGGDWSSVSGGSFNRTGPGASSSVSGGRARIVSGPFDWRAGELFEND